jgi:peptidoglycan/LPS O-acetylase OafA/YrhL
VTPRPGSFPGASLANWVPHDPLVQAKKTVWTLAYVHIWTPKDHFPHPELAQTWSLAVEMHFYVLWSVGVAAVVLMAPRRARPLLLALALGVVVAVALTRAWRLLDGQEPLLLFSNTPNRIDGPFVGAVGGLLYASGWLDRVSRPWGVGLALTGLAGTAVLVATGDPFSDWFYLGGFTLAAVLGCAVVVGVALLDDGPLIDTLASRR